MNVMEGLETLVQAGSVGGLGILAWLSYQFNKAWQDNNREWRTYLTERNSKLETALDKLSATLERTHRQ